MTIDPYYRFKSNSLAVAMALSVGWGGQAFANGNVDTGSNGIPTLTTTGPIDTVTISASDTIPAGNPTNIVTISPQSGTTVTHGSGQLNFDQNGLGVYLGATPMSNPNGNQLTFDSNNGLTALGTINTINASASPGSPSTGANTISADTSTTINTGANNLVVDQTGARLSNTAGTVVSVDGTNVLIGAGASNNITVSAANGTTVTGGSNQINLDQNGLGAYICNSSNPSCNPNVNPSAQLTLNSSNNRLLVQSSGADIVSSDANSISSDKSTTISTGANNLTVNQTGARLSNSVGTVVSVDGTNALIGAGAAHQITVDSTNGTTIAGGANISGGLNLNGGGISNAGTIGNATLSNAAINGGAVSNAASVSTGVLSTTGLATLGSAQINGAANTNGITNVGLVKTDTLNTTGLATLNSARINSGLDLNNNGITNAGTIVGATLNNSVINGGAINNATTVSTTTLGVSGSTNTAGITNTGALTNQGNLTVTGTTKLQSSAAAGANALSVDDANGTVVTGKATINGTSQNSLTVGQTQTATVAGNTVTYGTAVAGGMLVNGDLGVTGNIYTPNSTGGLSTCAGNNCMRVVGSTNTVSLTSAGANPQNGQAQVVVSTDPATGNPSAKVVVTNKDGYQHGLYIDQNGTHQTVLSGGTHSTSLTLNDNGATFRNDTTGGPARVTGVANGVNPYDAVNKSQLDQLGFGLNSRINSLQNRSFAGVASVAAMASIPDPIAGHRYSFGMGYGNFGSQNAMAFGAKANIGDNIRVGANLGYGSSDISVGLGAGFSW